MMTENAVNLTKSARLLPVNINVQGNPDVFANINASLTLSAMEGYEITECRQDEESAGFFEIFASFLGAVICVTNLIVIVVILKGGNKLHKPTFYCICNLAVADLLAGLLLLWIFGLQKAVLPIRTPGSELVQKSIWTVAIWSSMLSQLVIAIDRYCYVTKGCGYGGMSVGRYQGDVWRNRKRKRWIKAGILTSWIIPLLTFVVPVMTGWNCTNGCACYKLQNSTSNIYYMICLPLEKCSQMNPPFAKGSMLYVGLMLISMPTVPCILYAKIYYFVRTATKKFRPSMQPRPSKVNNNPSFNSLDNQVENSRFGSPQDADKELNPSLSNIFLNSSSPNSGDKSAATPGKRTSQCPSTKRKMSQLSWSQRILNIHFINPLHRKSSSYIEATVQASNNEAETMGQTPLNITVSKPKTSHLSKNSQKRDLRLLYTLVIILVLFLVSTVPLGVLFLVSFTETDKSYVLAAKILLTASLFNSMVNPWVYFWRFPEMRSAFKTIFCSCFEKCKKNSKNSRRSSVSTKNQGDLRRTVSGGAFDYSRGEARRGSKSDSRSTDSAM